ncbi:MAG: hypothetical protein NVSMB62_18590 [Acidobacteriaceae bacterium]
MHHVSNQTMDLSGPKHDWQAPPLRHTEPAEGRLSKARNRVREDGVYLVVRRMLGAPLRGLRNYLIGSRLHARNFRIGRDSRLRGLAHMAVGSSFSGGDSIWIEAVTRYEGQSYSPEIMIGNNVTISDNVHIGATCSIHIGNGVLIGSRVTVIDHNHGIYDGVDQSSPLEPPSRRRLSSHSKIEIGEDVWIGEGVTVLPGASVGRGSILGANSVVIGSIPAYCIAVGSPARPVRTYDFETKEWVQCRQLS